MIRALSLTGILFVYFILYCAGIAHAYTSIGAGAWADIYADLNANFGQIETDIAAKEDALGNPASDGYVLSSTAAGARSWIEMSGGSMSWPASDSVYYGAYNGAWVALTEVFQSPLVAGTDYLTPTGASEAYEGILTCTTGQIKKWGASGWECDADDTGSGSVPDGTVDGQVLLWSTDQWVASTFPIDLASPGEIGGTTPAAGTFTTISASLYQSNAADGSRYSIWPNNTSISPIGDGSVESYNEAGIPKLVVNDTEYPIALTIASGTAVLGTSEISSGACATVVSSAGTNIATTDVIDWTFNADPSSTTGYNPSGDLLYIVAYPTAGYANFSVCNKSGSAITPGAVTLNWKVQR